ncbi:MAG: signal peptidase I [Tenacibaculum sp.]
MKSNKNRILIYGLAIALLGFIWLTVDVVKLSSNSMFPTYKDGDYLISLNTKWFSPKPNDVVIFKKAGKLVIKRIVPIKNHRIYKYDESFFSTNHLINKKRDEINAVEYILPRKNQLIKGVEEIRKYDHFIESETKKNLMLRNGIYYLGIKEIKQYQFKNNFFFVKGDNKKKSSDSRKFGVIPRKDIVAKVVCKLW